jgi:hypothetical protein
MTNTHALEPALVRFARLLETRLHRSVPTSEDDIRYTFFFALHEKLGLMPEDIILEGHHGTIAGAKLDTRIPALAGTAYTIEFKYDRSIPSRHNQPRPQKPGQMLKDLFRLAQITSLGPTQAVFVYFTSSEMAGYFSNPANGLDGLFKLNVGTNLPITNGYLAGRSDTLLMAAGPITPCVVEAFFPCGLPSDHQLRVYGVTPMALRL